MMFSNLKHFIDLPHHSFIFQISIGLCCFFEVNYSKLPIPTLFLRTVKICMGLNEIHNFLPMMSQTCSMNASLGNLDKFKVCSYRFWNIVISWIGRYTEQWSKISFSLSCDPSLSKNDPFHYIPYMVREKYL